MDDFVIYINSAVIVVALFLIWALLSYTFDYGVFPIIFNSNARMYFDACKRILRYYRACPYTKSIISEARLEILKTFKRQKKNADEYTRAMCVNCTWGTAVYWATVFVWNKLYYYPKPHPCMRLSVQHKYEEEELVLKDLSTSLRNEINRIVNYSDFPKPFEEKWLTVIIDEDTEYIYGSKN